MQASFMIGGWTVHFYGLGIALAAFALLMGMGVAGYRRRLPLGTVRVFGVLAIPLGILLARLLFCLVNLSLFTETYENPWLMLRFFDGGLSMPGALLGMFLAALLTARIMNVRLGQLLDVMALPLGLFLALCRAAEGFTELGVGKIVEEGFFTQHLPWLFLRETAGIATEYRLAVYGYEAAAGLLIFLLMLVLSSLVKRSRQVRPGDLALVFFSLYGASQMLLESMRDDGHMLITFLRVGQVLAALLPILATAVFARRYSRIRGKGGLRVQLSWLVVGLCVALGVLLEFSLDGRITWGTPSLLRDYLLLAGVSAALFLVPYSLFTVLRKRVYLEGHITVHV